MVKRTDKRTVFRLRDFENNQEQIVEHLTRTVGEIAAMVWVGYNFYRLVNNDLFQLMRIGDNKYTIIVQKYYHTDEVSVWVIMREEKSY
mgnify:CR=1 FL=1